jgi:hypothetical protein
MKLTLVVVLLTAAPAFAQSRVYTNADLGKPLAATLTTSPAEAAAILAPHQFVYVPPAPAGPTLVLFGGSPTTGPYGEFAPFAQAQRLDGTLYSDWPWRSTAYLPYGYGRGRPVASPRSERSGSGTRMNGSTGRRR